MSWQDWYAILGIIGSWVAGLSFIGWLWYESRKAALSSRSAAGSSRRG